MSLSRRLKLRSAKSGFWAILFASLFVFSGCGDLNRSPLVSDEGEAPEASVALERSQIFIFGLTNRPRAAKPVPQGTAGWRVRVDAIGPPGGDINLIETNGPGPEDDLAVHFSVPQGALNVPRIITMGVFGETLSGLTVAFNPDGLIFSPSAELKIVLGLDRIDLLPDDLRVLHQHDDGSVDEPNFSIDIQGPHVIIRVEVPGFSEYTYEEEGGDD